MEACFRVFLLDWNANHRLLQSFEGLIFYLYKLFSQILVRQIKSDPQVKNIFWVFFSHCLGCSWEFTIVFQNLTNSFKAGIFLNGRIFDLSTESRPSEEAQRTTESYYNFKRTTGLFRKGFRSSSAFFWIFIEGIEKIACKMSWTKSCSLRAVFWIWYFLHGIKTSDLPIKLLFPLLWD